MTKYLYKLKYVVVIMVLLLFGFSEAYAQIQLSGIVTEENGVPIPGVAVVKAGTADGSVTDINGKYVLSVASSDTLVFSFIGYETKRVAVPSSSNVLNVTLAVNTKRLEEVVIVGYGTQKKKEVTGAVATLETKDLTNVATTDMASALQGRIAGVNVTASSGSPGAVSDIQIRGLGSLASGAGPLFVVDGIPQQGNPNIANELIESATVLKDGAAASIYGTRASNGVILITTKRGAAGKSKFQLHSYYGIQNITSGIPLLNAKETIYVNEIQNNRVGLTSNILAQNPRALDNDTDWIGILTNDNAPIQAHSLTMSGGNDNITYSVGANYQNQKGVLSTAAFEKFTTRMNTTITQGKFKAFVGIGLDIDKRNVEPWGLYRVALWQSPTSAAFPSEEEEISQLPLQNTFQTGRFAKLVKDVDERHGFGLWANASLRYDILPWLGYELKVGGNKGSNRREFFSPSFIVRDFQGEIAGGSQEDARIVNGLWVGNRWTVENLIHLKKSFGKHNITGLLGYTAENYNQRVSEAQGTDFLSNDIRVFNGAGETIGATGNLTEQSLIGSLARVMYNYDEKYIVSASIRRDGSSNFPVKNRFGVFWGASIGYNISEENFFKNINQNVVESIKLRASYGEVGNQNIAPYSFAPSIISNVDYIFGPEGSETGVAGAAQGQFANNDLKWETNLSSNIGIDFSFFKGKILASVDVYHNEKQDMLLPEFTPPSLGTFHPSIGNLRTIVKNVGNMVNKGIEVTVGYRNNDHQVKYSFDYTFTQNVNTVTSLGENISDFTLKGGVPDPNAWGEFTNFIVEGRPAPSFFLIPTDGLIKTQEGLAEYRKISPDAELGDLKLVDVNGDGKFDDLDRTYAGTSVPRFEMGLSSNVSWKNFDLSAQLFYSFGSKLYNGSRYSAYRIGRHKDFAFQYTSSNTESNIPTSGRSQNYQAISDYFLEDGTFLRVKNLQLGYTLPKSLTDRIKIQGIRIYVSATNPFTITNYTGFDPEVGGGLYNRGVDTGFYPVARNFLLGANINF